jgi:uncharacterized 2Fe-2S/4Fe-4S cluster protein (DUF4445 family)
MREVQSGEPRCRVDLEPVGRRVEIAAGDSLLDAARAAGVDLVAVCGGEGWCYTCVVRPGAGNYSPVTSVERDGLSPDRLAAGYRLACQCRPSSDVAVEIPPESLATQQRLQLEGTEIACAPEPVVTALDVAIPPATIHDLRSDVTRVQDAAAESLGEHPVLPYTVLRDLSNRLRTHDWSVRLGVRRAAAGEPAPRCEVVAILPAAAPLMGLAVDIGTTKIAAYLLDLATGRTVARAGAVNPQIAYGEDVLSRIRYTIDHADGRATLQARVVSTLNELVMDLCAQAGASREQIVDAVVVGNTAMHHLFAGFPVRQLGLAPYVPAVSDPTDIRAVDLGLELARGACVHLPANVAGFVGADHVAMALGTGAWETGRTLVAVDIGTNTEVTVTKAGRIWSCSCASGPAFEGAHIRDGMRAVPGAIERVQIANDGTPHLRTIGNLPPVGICGSGILDAVSELLRSGIIDRKGNMQAGAARVSRVNGMLQYELVAPPTSGHDRPVVVTRADVNEVQLAKAAIRAGVEVLLLEAEAGYAEIKDFIVAGAFGSYLDIGNSIRIGMFPPLPVSRFRQVGNAAGEGARQMLLSAARRRAAAEKARQAAYVELTVHREFTKRYMQALYL